MANAAVCAGLAAFAAFAVAAGYARKVVQKLADVETAEGCEQRVVQS